ncbi:MAG: hypothetical protein R3185_04770 [Candidatus Thermoplasmatota archaeon]|nr:hypothetical protein [Candidatus Thermoplasmatota archaeon]
MTRDVSDGPRIRDYPDDEELWEDIEDHLIPDPRELATSGPYGPAFTYLHAARVTLDAGLFRPTILLTRTAARLILATAAEQEEDPDAQEREQLDAIAHGEVAWEEAEDLLEPLATLSAFVERRLQVPGRDPSAHQHP